MKKIKLLAYILSWHLYFVIPSFAISTPFSNNAGVDETTNIIQLIDRIKSIKIANLKIEGRDTIAILKQIEQGDAFKKTDITKSLDLASKALELSITKQYKRGIVNSLILYGVLLKNSGKYEYAAKCYYTAMKISEERHDIEKVSVCLNNIGSIYQAQNNLAEAKKYYLKSLEIEKQRNNKAQQSLRMYNLGAIYEMMDSNNLAKVYYYNSLLIEESIKNKEGIYYALNGLAGVSIKENDIANATKYLSKAIEIAQELGHVGGLAACYLEKGRMFEKENNYSEAIISFHKAVSYARQIGYKNEERASYLHLSELFENLKRTDSAFAYLKKYNILNDVLNGIEAQNKISEYQERYEIEKKEREIDLLKKEKEFTELETSHQHSTRIYLIIVIILTAILIGYNIKNIYKDLK